MVPILFLSSPNIASQSRPAMLVWARSFMDHEYFQCETASLIRCAPDSTFCSHSTQVMHRGEPPLLILYQSNPSLCLPNTFCLCCLFATISHLTHTYTYTPCPRCSSPFSTNFQPRTDAISSPSETNTTTGKLLALRRSPHSIFFSLSLEHPHKRRWHGDVLNTKVDATTFFPFI